MRFGYCESPPTKVGADALVERLQVLTGAFADFSERSSGSAAHFFNQVPGQHEWWHAQQVGARIEAEALAGAGSTAPAVPRQQPAHVQAVRRPSLPREAGLDRRVVEASCEP